jgi:hypothetical protein
MVMVRNHDQDGDRFRLHCDNLEGPIRYSFLDAGEVVERGYTRTVSDVVKKYEAFKAARRSANP